MKNKIQRILIFDDDKISFQYTKSILEDNNYLVEIITDKKIFKRLKNVCFDLVCIDMLIHSHSLGPDGEAIENIKFDNANWKETGLEFYRRLRVGLLNDSKQFGTQRNVPVIFLSALPEIAMNASILQSINQDENTYHIRKPIRSDELLDLISKLET